MKNMTKEDLRFRGFMSTAQLLFNPMNGGGVELFTDWMGGDSNYSGKLIPSRLMIGKRAERYFAAFIEQNPRYEALLENIQVSNSGITLGEFDFFLKDLEKGRIIHVELVYKFYLLDPSIDRGEGEQWIGPNRNDWLNLKLAKLTEKQFPLIDTPEGKAVLDRYGIDRENVRQELLFLGNLFLPYEHHFESKMLKSEAVEGRWFHFSELTQEKLGEADFFIPERQDWFIRELLDVDWMDFPGLLERLEIHMEKKRAPLVWKRNLSGELERFFVVWW